MTGAGSDQLGAALKWAIDANMDAAMASADWLATDIDADHPTVVSLLTDPEVSMVKLRRAKDAYKTMRIVGETVADRRLGARLYAAAIAAGLVWRERRISTQSDEALLRAFRGLLDDNTMPRRLRDLAGRAICVIDWNRRDGSKTGPGETR